MPFYSANRLSTISEGAMTGASKGNYDIYDIDRVVYECYVNDQRIFEAAICCDIREAAALQEGTMTLAEADFKIGSTLKSIGGKMKKGWESFWGKIKKIFKAAREKLYGILSKNSKMFTTIYSKRLDKFSADDWNKQTTKFGDKPIYVLKNPTQLLDTVNSSLKAAVDYFKNSARDVNSITDDDAKSSVSALKGIADIFSDKKIDAAKLAVTTGTGIDAYDELNAGNYKEVMKSVSNTNYVIGVLKKAEANTDRAINDAIKQVAQFSTKGDETAQKRLTAYRKVSSTTQKHIASIVKGIIKLLSKCVSSTIAAVRKVASKQGLDEANIIYMEAMAEMDEVFDSPCEGKDPDDLDDTIETDEGVNINISVD